MSFNGAVQFKKNLETLMNSSAFKNADDGQKLRLGGLLLQSKYGAAGIGKVQPLPEPSK